MQGVPIHFSDKEIEQILRMRNRGYKIREIADFFGVSRKVIWKHVGSKDRVHFSETDIEDMKCMYESGFSYYTIGDKYGVSHGTVRKYVSLEGRSVLKKEAIRASIDAKTYQIHKDGMSLRKIARHYNITVAAVVCRIKRHKSRMAS